MSEPLSRLLIKQNGFWGFLTATSITGLVSFTVRNNNKRKEKELFLSTVGSTIDKNVGKFKAELRQS